MRGSDFSAFIFIIGCFLDASKAFDMVDHGLLFQKLLDRGLPLPVVRFLLSWYSLQDMKVRSNSSTVFL